jgi:ribonuclease-3
LGAVAIASQWNQEVLQNAVEKMLQLESFLEESDRHRYRPESMSADNAVDTLKKLTGQGQCSVLIYEYRLPKELGYDETGNAKWVCTYLILNDTCRL